MPTAGPLQPTARTPGESRRVGLVGGLGPESTIDYYRRILAAWEAQAPGSSPGIVIDSLDVQVGLRLAAADHAALADYLHASIERLACAGCEFVALTANTAHLVFDELARRSSVPLLSIVEACAAEAKRRDFARVGLLGTRFTMEAPFYPATFGREGIAVVAPRADEREWVHARYVGELLRGEFRDDTRAGFVALANRLCEEERIDAIAFAGTELPLLLPSPMLAGVPVLDTTALHVAAIVERLR